MSDATFADLPALAQHLRTSWRTKKFVLLYAYNGTGKTRLSTAFKDLGKNADGETTARHALLQRLHRRPVLVGQRPGE